jgi:RimJ/RimL family protein N-acetyltransferase
VDLITASLARWTFADLGLARIQLEHAVANTGSCRVATKAGFGLEGTLRSAYLDSLGVRHDEQVHGRQPPTRCRDRWCHARR